jgi:antitoxin (DNA-binding transcriptional repressor) of toxin-antitoxin stability system
VTRSAGGESKVTTITLQEAQANLADLVYRLDPGEGVTITENDRPVAWLERVPADVGRPVAGSAKGMLTILEEDDRLADFREYME